MSWIGGERTHTTDPKVRCIFLIENIRLLFYPITDNRVDEQNQGLALHDERRIAELDKLILQNQFSWEVNTIVLSMAEHGF